MDVDPVVMERDPLALDEGPVITEENLFCCQVCNIQLIGFSNYTEKEKVDIIKIGRPQPKLESLTVASLRCTRRFNPNTYKSYEWLTGCERRSKLFCWSCLLFSEKNTQWRLVGLSDLNNLHGSLKRHASSHVHIESFLRLKTFGKIGLNVKQSSALNGKDNDGQVFTNRDIIKNLIQSLCFLAKHPSPNNLGEMDPTDPIGKNRFLDFIDLMSEFDDIIKKNVKNMQMFLGTNVRNNLITSISNTVYGKIKEEIRSAHFLSIILNEVAELGETILVSVILRFTTKNFVVCERFFGFRQIPSSRLAEPLFDIVQSVVKSADSVLKMVAYCYDGGVILTDQLPKFQSKVKELCPNALNLHYFEHQLSSILEKSLSSITECKHFFSTINSLSSLFLKSKKLREELNTLNRSMKPNSSDFDWTINGSLIKNIHKIRQPLIELFEEISRSEGEWGFEIVFSTAGYLATFKFDVSFNLLLSLLSEVFVLADDLSDVLQVTADDVMVCSQKVQEFINIIQVKRDSFYLMYQEIMNLFNNDEPPLKKIKSEENFKKCTDSDKTLYDSVLWNIICHMNCRFRDLSKLQFISFKTIEQFTTGRDVLVNGTSNFLPSFIALPALSTEFGVLSKYLSISESTPKNLLKYLRQMGLESAFPQIVSFCELILTLPVWKSASVFNTLKSYTLNSSLSHQLSNLAILSIEKELVDKLLRQSNFYDEVIRDFIKTESSIPLGFTT